MTVAINNPLEKIPEELRKEGTRVIVYEVGTECEAILRRAEGQWEWVADIVPGTVRETPWNRPFRTPESIRRIIRGSLIATELSTPFRLAILAGMKTS